MHNTSGLAAMAISSVLLATLTRASKNILGSAGKLFVDNKGSGSAPVVFVHSFYHTRDGTAEAPA